MSLMLPGVFGNKSPPGGLHGFVALAAAFMHHHGHNRLCVFRYTMFSGAWLDLHGAGFHPVTGPGLFRFSAAAEQSTHCAKRREQPDAHPL